MLAYACGSGDRGLTAVGRDEAGQWCELRMSCYAGGLVRDVTTGHDHGAGRIVGVARQAPERGRAEAVRRLPHDRAKGRAGRRRRAAEDHGIRCERCHGPGGNHLKAVAAELVDLAIARPKLARGEPIVRLCGHCHSPRGRTVSASDPGLIRFQATTLTWSRCYTQSKDQLDCVTCHDPHRNAETSRVFSRSRSASTATARKPRTGARSIP